MFSIGVPVVPDNFNDHIDGNIRDDGEDNESDDDEAHDYDHMMMMKNTSC